MNPVAAGINGHIVRVFRLSGQKPICAEFRQKLRKLMFDEGIPQACEPDKGIVAMEDRVIAQADHCRGERDLRSAGNISHIHVLTHKLMQLHPDTLPLHQVQHKKQCRNAQCNTSQEEGFCYQRNDTTAQKHQQI